MNRLRALKQQINSSFCSGQPFPFYYIRELGGSITVTIQIKYSTLALLKSVNNGI